ncbi:MAG TPA: hypothetical protein VGM68_07435 [Rhizomicrobium sp.]|jgi:hypothetical protein
MNKDSLITATSIGLVLQLAMVVGGHYVPMIKENFAIGGMLISLVAGLLYARKTLGSWSDALIGGGIAGGVCALIGIAVSVLLKDVPAMILAIGTAASAVTGLVGGAIGKLIRTSA